MFLSLQFRILRPSGFPRPLFLRNRPQLTSALHRPFSSTIGRCGILGLERNPSNWKHAPTREQLRQNRERRAKALKHIPVYPQPPGAYSKVCPEPLKAVNAHQLALLDPTGARSKLFDPTNLEGAKVGDILLVRTKEGDPFAGVCIDIRQRGVDTSILLRGNLTRVAVEMWYKIYSPNIESIEIVQRRLKRARRARLYYMRQPKHDIGSVENVVRQYLRQRQALRSGEYVKGRDANSNKKQSKKSK